MTHLFSPYICAAPSCQDSVELADEDEGKL
jgi:hypothetical protein